MAGRAPVAVVTGASRGIGKACAIALAEAGHDVVIAARSLDAGAQELSETVHQSEVRPMPGSLHETAAEIEKLGRRALPVRVDLAQLADVDGLFERTMAEFGRIDVLVNNARWVGPGYKDPFIDTPYQVYADSFLVNALAPLYLLKRVVPVMIEQGGGVVIHISSLSGIRETEKDVTGDWKGATGLAYNISKAGFNRIAPGLAKELRRYNIAVVNVEPGDVSVERKAVQRGEGFAPETMDPPHVAGRTCAYVATSKHPMFYSGLTVYAPSFAVEHGLVDPDEMPPSRGRPGWGSPERMMPIYRGQGQP
jgi:NAD(P)-dependent dehydrogenase (short-subunit alcohol dehydrogenase family)